MADDIFLTPEEQDERAKQWLKDNGMALVVGVALGLGAVFGYNQYQARQITNAEQASALYTEASTRFQQSELADISQPLERLKSDFSHTPYAAKAVLLRAKQLSVSDLSAAVPELQWVVDNAKETGLKHTALIRLAKVYLALGDLDKAHSTASGKSSQGFDSHYLEILGDIAVRRDEIDAARQHYQGAIDALAPADRGYSRILTLKMNRLPIDDVLAEAEADTQAEAEVPLQ